MKIEKSLIFGHFWCGHYLSVALLFILATAFASLLIGNFVAAFVAFIWRHPLCAKDHIPVYDICLIRVVEVKLTVVNVMEESLGFWPFAEAPMTF